ncbi:hypothetical protein HDU97_002862 [Phlyctochytrium planicorne]|nr:hypothetical protein HDU97_002862 [Phlyctochytrium planicorne]
MGDVYKLINGPTLSNNTASMALENDSDRPGWDMKKIPTDDAEGCRFACHAEDTCMAFTFNAYLNEKGGDCWLKNGVPEKRENVPNRISGVVMGRYAWRFWKSVSVEQLQRGQALLMVAIPRPSLQLQNRKDFVSNGFTPLQAYVPKYVRSLTSPDGDSTTKGICSDMLSLVKEGKPFLQQEDFVVAMIDISGYSTVVSALTVLGKFSSELISQSVGSYLRKIMRVVDEYSGDVLKFLGDAILVTFRRLSTGEDMEKVSLRAAACCAECLLEHEEHIINLEEFTRNRTFSASEEMTIKRNFTLSLHIGLLLGTFKHVILGSYDNRLEYCIYGESLSELSMLLENTVAGEVAFSGTFAAALQKNLPGLNYLNSKGPPGSLIVNVKTHRDNLSSIYELYSDLFQFQSSARRGTEFATYPRIQEIRSNSVVDPPIANTNSNDASPANLADQLPDPLYRFVNTSFLSRLLASGNFSFRPDYRRVSVVFAKLTGEFNPDSVQGSISAFIDAVNYHEKHTDHSLTRILHFSLQKRRSAARLLSWKPGSGNIFLDDETKKLISEDFECCDMGSLKVKGKEAPIQVWCLATVFEPKLKQDYTKIAPETTFLGYEREISNLLEGYYAWKGQGEDILSQETNILMARGSEVEQWTQFFGLQPILCHILKLSRNFLSLDQGHVRSGSESIASSKATNSGKGLDYSLQEFENLLVECGENPQYASLLSQILPWLKYSHIESVERLSTPSKNKIISSLFLKVLMHFLSKEDCVLILDDAQWIDSASISVYSQLFHQQGRHYCLIFSRPITSDVENGLNQIIGLPLVTNIQINGMSKEDAILFMSRILKAPRIRQEIYDPVYDRTNGNIIQTQMICQSLFSQKDKIFLEPLTCHGIKNPTLFESIVFGSSASVISSQLDRLSSEFQRLLVNASALGQYFSLEDVEYLFQPDVVTVQGLVEIIEECDIFKYLSFTVNGLDAGVEATVGKTFCSFRHIKVMYAIYDSISVADRTSLHEKIAILYESMAVEDARAKRQLLPSLHHHYSKTSNILKIIEYGEACGDVHFFAAVYREARVYYTKCVEYWKGSSSSGVIINAFQKGRILSKLSYCMTLPLVSLEMGREYGMEALKLAGEEFGTDTEKIKIIVKKDLKRFLRFWVLSKQGRKDINFRNPKERKVYKEWHPNIRFALLAMNTGALSDTTMSSEMKMMILLKSVIYALSEAASNPIQVVAVFNYLIMGLYSSPSKGRVIMARYFSKRMRRIVSKCPREVAEYMLLFGIAEIYLNGNLTAGIKAVNEFFEYVTEIRKLSSIVRSYIWAWPAWLAKGDLQVPTISAHPLLPDLQLEDPVYICLAMNGALTCQFLMGNHQAFLECLEFLQESIRLVPAKLIGIAPVHHNIFKLMGCLLVTENETKTSALLKKAFSECNDGIGVQPDVAFVYSLVACLLALPRKIPSAVVQALTEIVISKLELYKKLSCQGPITNFSYFMMQSAAFALGKSKAPTKLADAWGGNLGRSHAKTYEEVLERRTDRVSIPFVWSIDA